jgi:hypothetical protein
VTSGRLHDAPLTFHRVPDKVTHPIETVECERRGEDGLPCELHSFRKARNELDDVCTIERSGNEEVRKGIAVKHYGVISKKTRKEKETISECVRMKGGRHTSAKARTSYSVRNRPYPCELGLVDSEMRRGRSDKALFVQDLEASRRRKRFGFYGPTASMASIQSGPVQSIYQHTFWAQQPAHDSSLDERHGHAIRQQQ